MRNCARYFLSHDQNDLLLSKNEVFLCNPNFKVTGSVLHKVTLSHITHVYYKHIIEITVHDV